MHTIDLLLHPDSYQFINCIHAQSMPENLRKLILSISKNYDVNICGYDCPSVKRKPRLYYFSNLAQFDAGPFVSHALERNLTEKDSNLALLDFHLTRRSPSSVVFFKDIVFMHLDPDKCMERVCSHLERSNDRNESISQYVAEAFYQLSFVGKSKIYQNVVSNICKMADCQAPLLLEGETGTGKELLARAAHNLRNNSKSFVPVNCAAIPDTLFESEMFGHEKGAFTSAQQKKPGLVEMAQGGTLFLDEVNSLSEKAQSALLRFLQSGEYRSVGSNLLKQASVRIISATNVPLEQEVSSGKFRQDLMFRLNVLNLTIPPLRERAIDIEIIANHLLQRFEHKYQRGQKILHPLTTKWLSTQAWPGNVRELENLLLREYLLERTAIIKMHEVTEDPGYDLGSMLSPELDDKLTELKFHDAKHFIVDQFTAHYVKAMLQKTSGNITRAAVLSGKERRAFGRLVKKYASSDEFAGGFRGR